MKAESTKSVAEVPAQKQPKTLAQRVEEHVAKHPQSLFAEFHRYAKSKGAEATAEIATKDTLIAIKGGLVEAYESAYGILLKDKAATQELLNTANAKIDEAKLIHWVIGTVCIVAGAAIGSIGSILK